MFPSQDGKAPQSLPAPGQSVTVKDLPVLLMFGCRCIMGMEYHLPRGKPPLFVLSVLQIFRVWEWRRRLCWSSEDDPRAVLLRSAGTSARGCVQWSSVRPWLSERKEGVGMEHGGWASLPGRLWGPLVLLLLSRSDTPGCLWDSAWCCQSCLRQSVGSKRASAFIYWKTKDCLESGFLFAPWLWCMHLQNTFSY